MIVYDSVQLTIYTSFESQQYTDYYIVGGGGVTIIGTSKLIRLNNFIFFLYKCSVCVSDMIQTAGCTL